MTGPPQLHSGGRDFGVVAGPKRWVVALLQLASGGHRVLPASRKARSVPAALRPSHQGQQDEAL